MSALEARDRELRAAHQQLAAFSHSVSHDLRAPLRAIRGFSQLLIENFAAELPAEAPRLLRSVSGSAARMSQLIDDLLRFARLGQQPLSSRTVNVAQLVGEVIDDLRNQRADRPVDVRIGELPEAEADRTLLKLVYTSLLSNAFKFTEGVEHPIIGIGAERHDASVEYFVRDNGIGFDMQHAERLFGVFQRLHGGSRFEGTGIGLALARQIVERHGGRILVHAQPGRGATFYFTLGPA